jgi:alkylation response protein AidB-like acyl-CoA dehydrogenase
MSQLSGTDLMDRLGLRPAAERAMRGMGEATGKLLAAAPGRKRRPPAERPAERPAVAAAGEPARLATVPSTGIFDLTPTEDQELIRASARRLADEVLRPAAADADVATAPDPAVLAKAQELALAALVVPDALGGAAETRAAVTTSLVIEELARGDMGLALAALAPLGAVSALVDFGSRAQQERWLAPLTGETFVGAALAVLEGAPGRDPARPQSGAVRSAGGWKLYGEKWLVPLGESAELFVVLAEIRGLGPRLFLVPKGAPGLSVKPQPAMGLRAAGLCSLGFDGVELGDDAVLGGADGRGLVDAQAVVDHARLAWGAMAVGGARAVLEYVIPYCNERVAFGEPISHRQSVAFLIADLAIELEGMRLLVQRAAALADQGQPFTREARLVRTQCGAKAMKAGTDGVQLLGGHGFIKEHPVERWYRDLRAVAVMEGALWA